MAFNLGTTGIGSHPLPNPRQVILHIFESGISYPYVPQLKTDEMTYQFHHYFPGLTLKKGNAILDVNTPDFDIKLKKFRGNLKLRSLKLQPHGMELTSDYFKSLFIFSEMLSKISIRFDGIKCQMTGPITEAASIKIYPSNQKLIQTEELFETIVDLTAEVAHWLSYYLTKIAEDNGLRRENVVLFIDEPLFPLSVENEIPYEIALEKISKVLQLIQCKKGIHICDNPITVIDLVLQYPIDIFSYDAIRYPDSLKNTNTEVLHNYIERGGGFAFGITPNTPESVFGVENIPKIQTGELDPEEFLPTASDLIHRLQKNIHPISKKGIPIQKLLKQSLISPACGFRNFNIPSIDRGEKLVLKLLQLQEKASKKLKKTYNLT